MHVKGFLHKMLSSVMHKKRFETFVMLINTVFMTKRLSVTELGRGMDLPIQERSCIRRVDRFLSNEKIYQEKMVIHELLITNVVGAKTCLDIIVDWTNVPNTTHHILRASLATEGRAITLYEEVHPQKKLENPKVHRKFLARLKDLLPSDCKIVIITDGGFHNEWFRDVLRCGWDYLGRIRVGSGKKFCQTGGLWRGCGELVERATATPKYMGNVKLCKNDPLETNLYLYKGEVRHRKHLNKFGQKKGVLNEAHYRKAAYEPWILATSLEGKSFLSGKRAVKKYRKRMQIEEGLRDLKSTRYGFSFENAHSYKTKRIEILLLIAMLASFVAWLTGWVGEKQKLHYQFQSNSIKTRRVLSLFFLGCQIIRRKIAITMDMIDTAINRGLFYA